MSANQLIVVPQISRLPNPKRAAESTLAWLVRQNIVQPLPSTCGRGGNGMAYGIAEGASNVVETPRLLPFGQAVSGLEVVTRRCIYTPVNDFLEEAGCPECRQEIGEPLFASLDEWTAGLADNFTCPLCGFEDDVNGFLYLQPCGFSNLGLLFNNWGATRFTEAFLEQLTARLGFKVREVLVSL